MDICIVAYWISLKNWAIFILHWFFWMLHASTFTNKNALFCFEFFRYRHILYSCLAGSFKFVVVSGFMGVQYIICRNTQEYRSDHVQFNSERLLKCFTRSLLFEDMHFMIRMLFFFQQNGKKIFFIMIYQNALKPAIGWILSVAFLSTIQHCIWVLFIHYLDLASYIHKYGILFIKI